MGQVCAGHKNDLWFEVNGAAASVRWRQEQQNELWVGKRHQASAIAAQGSGAAVAARARLCASAGRTPGGLARRVRERVPRRLSRRRRRGGPGGWARRLGHGHVRGRLPRGLRRGRGAAQPPAGRRVDRRSGALDEAGRIHARVRRSGRAGDAGEGAARCATSRRSSWALAAGRDAITSTSRRCSTTPARPATTGTMVEDAGLTISALSCHGNPLHPDPAVAAKRRRRLPADRAAGRAAARGRGGHVLRLSRATRRCAASQLGHHGRGRRSSWTCWTGSGRRRRFPTGATRRDLPATTASRWRIEAHPGFLVYNPETALRLRAGGGRSDRRQLRPEPPVLAGRGHAGGDSRAG